MQGFWHGTYNDRCRDFGMVLTMTDTGILVWYLQWQMQGFWHGTYNDSCRDFGMVLTMTYAGILAWYLQWQILGFSMVLTMTDTGILAWYLPWQILGFSMVITMICCCWGRGTKPKDDCIYHRYELGQAGISKEGEASKKHTTIPCGVTRAELDLASPMPLFTVQRYTPPSDFVVLLVITRVSPVPRCSLFPSFVHVMLGEGLPVALQNRDKTSPIQTFFASSPVTISAASVNGKYVSLTERETFSLSPFIFSYLHKWCNVYTPHPPMSPCQTQTQASGLCQHTICEASEMVQQVNANLPYCRKLLQQHLFAFWKISDTKKKLAKNYLTRFRQNLQNREN